MTATIRNIVDDAQEIVGEVTGPGVQMYSDDRCFSDCIRGLNMLFKKYNWRHYCNWVQLTLDGSTGTAVTDDLLNVLDFEDIIAVRRDGSRTNLSMRPRHISPFQSNMLSGNGIIYWDALNVSNPLYNKKKIYLLPKTATGKINVYAKFYPVQNDAWDWQDTIYLDRDLLAYSTAYTTLAGDDLNAAAADMCKNMMEMKYKDIMSQLSSHDINFSDSQYGGVPDQWVSYP